MKNYLFALAVAIGFAQPPATPAANLLTSTHTLDSLVSQSLVAKLPLTNIGPSVMSGRVTDLDVNPNAPHEFYVGYASGGLWYTNNNGTTNIYTTGNKSVTTYSKIRINNNLILD